MSDLFKRGSIGQLMELLRILQEAGFGSHELTRVIGAHDKPRMLLKMLAEILNVRIADPQEHLNVLLPSISAQIALTETYLEKFASELKLSDDLVGVLFERLNEAEGSVEPTQSVRDCHVIFIWLGCLHKTFKFYRLMVEDRQKQAGWNGIYEGIDFDTHHMELGETAYGYGDAPRVYLVSGLDLLDNWNPKGRSSADIAREQAKDRKRYYLASLEALAVYALANPKLYQSQDGEILPSYDMAGIRSGDDLLSSIHSYCWLSERKVCFRHWSSCADEVCAQPSFREAVAL